MTLSTTITHSTLASAPTPLSPAPKRFSGLPIYNSFASYTWKPMAAKGDDVRR